MNVFLDFLKDEFILKKYKPLLSFLRDIIEFICYLCFYLKTFFKLFISLL